MARLATWLLPVVLSAVWNVLATQQVSTTSAHPTSTHIPPHQSTAHIGHHGDTTVPDSGEDPSGSTETSSDGPVTSESQAVSGTEEPVTVPGYTESLNLLDLVTVPIFTVLGIVGNCLTLIIMTRNSFKSVTTSRILVALALSDLTVIIMTPFMKPFFIKLIGVNVLSLSAYSCKIFIWALRLAKLTSSWWILVIATERFLAIWFPLKVKTIVTKKSLFVALITIATMIGLFLGIWAGYCSVLVNGKCVPNLPIDPKYTRHAQVLALLGSVIHSYIPIGGTAVLNILTVVRLFKVSAARKALTKDSNDDVTARTSAMLFGVSIMFLILVSPNCLSQITLAYRGISFSQSTEPDIVILRAIVNALEHLNFTINFFLYVVCSRVFRGELVKILCYLPGRGGSEPSSSGSGTRMTQASRAIARAVSLKSQVSGRSRDTPGDTAGKQVREVQSSKCQDGSGQAEDGKGEPTGEVVDSEAVQVQVSTDIEVTQPSV